MTAEPQAATTPVRWATISARGEDAASFLQGQLSQDLSEVSEGGRWSLVLAPDSAVITTCFVTPTEVGLDLAVPSERGGEALMSLRRFLLRAKCELTLCEESGGPYETLGAQLDDDWPGANELAYGLTPHTFGARFVSTTISFQKGCFTGQELVGRLDARGSSVPWRLVHVCGPTVDSIDEVVRSKGPVGPQGVTSLVRRDGQLEGLALAHRSLLVEKSVHVGSVSVHEVA